MKSWLIAVVAAGVCGATAMAAQTPPAGAKKSDSGTKASASADAAFMRQAAMDGMAEVELGRLASQNGSAAEVKQFGQRMADDHSKANDELKGLASQKQVTLPTEIDQKHRAMQDKFAKMNGAAFDKAYMAHMVTAHQQAVSLFQQESKAGKDAEVKAWAGKTLPTLQEHLKMARTNNASVAKSKPSK
jgi:putative membrane protein